MAMRQKTVWGSIALTLFLSIAAPAGAQGRLPESLRKHVASKSQQPIDVIVHGTADEIARHRGAARAARHQAPVGGRRAADRRRATRGARRGRRSPVARRRGLVLHVGDRRGHRRRPGAGRAGRACRPTRARASAWRSSTRASGRVTARSRAGSSSRRTLPAMASTCSGGRGLRTK